MDRFRWNCVASGVLLLVLGYWFYALARPSVFIDGMGLPGLPGSVAWMPQWLWGSLPSFLHLLAFLLISYSLLAHRPGMRTWLVLCWLVPSFLYEFGQGAWFPGYFDVVDLGALLAAALTFLLWTSVGVSVTAGGRLRKVMLLPVVVMGVISTAGSEEYVYHHYEPIYLSYEDLRAPLTISQDRPKGKTGKIYLYQQYLLVNEPNQGIRVFDNTDSTNPVELYFIQLPGNLDMAVRNDHLFADSFIDLVSIDISDIQSPTIVARKENVFAYDPYQVIPEFDEIGEYIAFRYGDLDERRGVVVGYSKVAEE